MRLDVCESWSNWSNRTYTPEAITMHQCCAYWKNKFSWGLLSYTYQLVVPIVTTFLMLINNTIYWTLFLSTIICYIISREPIGMGGQRTRVWYVCCGHYSAGCWCWWLCLYNFPWGILQFLRPLYFAGVSPENWESRVLSLRGLLFTSLLHLVQHV